MSGFIGRSIGPGLLVLVGLLAVGCPVMAADPGSFEEGAKAVSTVPPDKIRPGVLATDTAKVETMEVKSSMVNADGEVKTVTQQMAVKTAKASMMSAPKMSPQAVTSPGRKKTALHAIVAGDKAAGKGTAVPRPKIKPAPVVTPAVVTPPKKVQAVSTPRPEVTSSQEPTVAPTLTPAQVEKAMSSLNSAIKRYNAANPSMITTLNPEVIQNLINNQYLPGKAEDYAGFSSNGDLTANGNIVPPATTQTTSDGSASTGMRTTN